MFEKLLKFIGIKQGCLILTASDSQLEAHQPEKFRRSWIGLLLLSLLWGVASMGLWNLSINIFGRPSGVNIMSAMVLTAAILLVPMRLGAGFLCELLGGKDSNTRMLFTSVLVMVFVMCLMSLRADWHVAEYELPRGLQWWRPLSKSNRVLMLLPLWGAWSMLILPNFYRVDPESHPQISAMGRGCGPMTAVIIMAVLLGWSGAYFAYLSWVQIGVSIAAVIAGVFGGLLLAHRNGQMDRKVLLAANLLTQLGVLVSFLALRNINLW
ncbi:MAG: hypothetical protein KAR11_04645 [Phycisphaerae bacterium]|nr:hypothetical protein [Phycisphaerae bacterium]